MTSIMPKQSIRCACAAAFGAVLVLGAPRPASAQEGSLILGFTRTNLTLSGVGAAPTSSVSGFLVGAAFTTSTKRPISLEVDGLLATKGTNAPTGLSLQLYYLECPLLGRTDVQISKNVRIHAYAGPQVGVLVHTGGSSTGFGNGGDDQVSRSDVSVVAGGGIDWRGTMVDIRYTRGLNQITSPVLFGSGVTARSQSVGLLFVVRVK
jgi:hypothetical protein